MSEELLDRFVTRVAEVGAGIDALADERDALLTERDALRAEVEELRARSFDDLSKRVQEWQRETFPDATPHSVAAHLRKEAKELSENPSDYYEAADCALLLIGHAQAAGYDLFNAIREKFAIVQQRQWGEPDADGVVEHIR